MPPDMLQHAGLRALLAQMAGGVLAAGMFFLVLTVSPHAGMGLWHVVGIQCVLAALTGLMLRLAWWWLPLNLLFVPALLLLHRLQLPTTAYLTGFLLLLLFNWGVLHSRVPLYLSRRAVWEKVAGLLPVDRTYKLLDIGSGLGGMLLYLDRARPQGFHEGVEIAPASWLVSRMRAAAQGARAIFRRQDYRRIDLASYDVVFAFLSPLVMQEVLAKARHEMRPGTLLVSLAFPLPGIVHDQVIKIGEGDRQTLYVWCVQREGMDVKSTAFPDAHCLAI